MLILSVIFAFFLDRLLGEPRAFHPLIGFGRWVDFLESKLNCSQLSKLTGVLGVTFAVVPAVLFFVWVDHLASVNYWVHVLVSGFVLYIAVGWQSLLEHAQKISTPLKLNDLKAARHALSMIVSRDTSMLEEKDIAKAATESVLENGADAIFSAVFWFCLFGIPGVVFYRLSNTLDAMWGYKNSRFISFGWCAARLDDALNFIPARLTALSYAIVGRFVLSIQYWRLQGFSWKSPNAGPVMAAGAGALNVSLGGAAVYHGERQIRPVLGPDETVLTSADSNTILQACALVNRSIILWGIIIVFAEYLI